MNRLHLSASTALAAVLLLVSAGCGTDSLTPIEGDSVAIAAYEPDGGSLDVVVGGLVVDLGDGCVGVQRLDTSEMFLLAVPVGSEPEGLNRVRVSESLDFGIGDEIRFSGSFDTTFEDTGHRLPIAVPPRCPTDRAAWYLLPLDD